MEQCQSDRELDHEGDEIVLPTDMNDDDDDSEESSDEADAEADAAAAAAATQQYQSQYVLRAAQCIRNCWDEVVDSYELCVKSVTICLTAVPISYAVPGTCCVSQHAWSGVYPAFCTKLWRLLLRNAHPARMRSACVQPRTSRLRQSGQLSSVLPDSLRFRTKVLIPWRLRALEQSPSCWQATNFGVPTERSNGFNRVSSQESGCLERQAHT